MEILNERAARIEVPYRAGTSQVNAYLARGEKIALIDTGVADHGPAAIRTALGTLGLRLEDVDYVINTHGHSDHTGGNPEVQRLAGARVHLHRHDLPMAQGVDAYMASPADNGNALRVLGRDDLVQARRAHVLAQLGGRFTVDQVLEDGDRIDLGRDVALRVIHTPGHSPGHVSLLLERDRALFSGDAVEGLAAGASGLPIYCSVSDYQASIRRLQDEEIDLLGLAHPFEWSHPHNHPVRRGDEVAITLRDSLESAELLDGLARAIMEADPRQSFESFTRAFLDEVKYHRPVQFHRELPALVGAMSAPLAHWSHERDRLGVV